MYVHTHTHTQITTEVGRNPWRSPGPMHCSDLPTDQHLNWLWNKAKRTTEGSSVWKSLGLYERKKKKILPHGDSSTAALHLLVWPFKIIQGKHMVEVCSWRVSKRGLSVLQWHTLFLSFFGSSTIEFLQGYTSAVVTENSK